MFADLLAQLTDLLLSWQGRYIVGTPTKVDILSPDGAPTEGVMAEINTTWDYSVIDEALARDLGLLEGEAVVEEALIPELGAKKRSVIMVNFILGGRQKRSRWAVMDRQKQACPVVVGRRDLAGFLVKTGEIV